MGGEKENIGTAAVMTADMVGSTNYPPGEVNRLLTHWLVELEEHVAWLVSPEIFRGDSFQGVLKNLEEVMRAAILARALSRREGADLRIAIGIGPVDRLAERSGISDGEAFRLSGQRADTLKAERAKIAVALPVEAAPVDAVLTLLESVIEKWTAAQAAVIVHLLKGETFTVAARELGISQSAVSQHAQAARWWAVDPLIRTFHQLIKIYYPHV